MTSTATFEDLMNFLDYLSTKGLMKEQTVASRKAVANKVFEVLDDEDRSDVLAVNLDDVMSRFINKVGSNYSPGSLQTYKSRLSSTLEDFQSYRQNPMGFRPSIATRAARKPKPSNETSGPETSHTPVAPEERQHIPTKSAMPAVDILPIPLRADLTVRVQGLPFDLTPLEAKKISSVIQAFVVQE